MGYDYDHRSQLERSASISISFSIYCRDNYDADFVSSQFNVEMTTLCMYLCHVFCEVDYICMYFSMFLPTMHVFMHFLCLC